ncbi:MAG: asparagine synthase [Bacillota bacterium]
MKRKSVGLKVAGLGALVAALGATIFKRSKYGRGIIGFGLAHIVLGMLDRMRTGIRS